MTPLRILLVGDYEDDPRLGSAKVAHKLREEFRAAGHECDALFASDLGRRPAGRQVRQLVSPLLARRAIEERFRRKDYDIVDAASAEGLWFGIGRRRGRHRRTAYVCRSHGLEHLNYQRMLDDSRAGIVHKPWSRRIWYPVSRLTQVELAARLSDRLLLLNETDKVFAVERNWLPAGRIDIVPHGVSDVYLTHAAVRGPRGMGALFCGSWDHMKGVHYLAEAFSRLARGGTPIPLTILGPGVPPAHVLAAFAPEARAHVTVMDRVPEDRVIAEFRRHDLLVFTSTYEGFGLVVIEAMSQALAVVATPLGCAATLVRDGVTGIRVPPRDPAAIAGAVLRLMRDPDERARLGANAAMAVSEMSWRSTALGTVETYRKALQHARHES